MELAHGAGLKVLLDGQGGDETLAGYFRYLPMRLRDLLARGDAGELRARLVGPVARRLGLAHDARAHASSRGCPPALVAPLRRRFGQGKDRVLAAALRAAAARAGLPRPPRGFPSALSRQLAFDTLQRLLPSLLRYEDRNSMAFSIETRLPFLDYRLVEFAFSLPDERAARRRRPPRRSCAARSPTASRARCSSAATRWASRRRPTCGCAGATPARLRRRLLAPGPLHEWLDRRGARARARGLPRRAARRSGSRSGAGSRSRRGRGASSPATARARRRPRRRRGSPGAHRSSTGASARRRPCAAAGPPDGPASSSPRCAGDTSARASSSCCRASPSAGACSSRSRRRPATTIRGRRGARGNVTYFTVPFLKPGTTNALYNAVTSTGAGRALIERGGRARTCAACCARLGVEPRAGGAWPRTSMPPRALSRLPRKLLFYDFNDSPVSVRRRPRPGPAATGSARCAQVDAVLRRSPSTTAAS